MKFSHRARLLLLSSALALAGPAAVAAAASPAQATTLPIYYAGPPHISALGGPGEIWVYGYNFPAGAKVRVEALTNPGLKSLDTPQYTTANSAGDIDVELYGLNSGPAWVLADSSSGTVGAQTVVQPPPFFLYDTGQLSCGSLVVTVDAVQFMPGYNVEVELKTADGFPVPGAIVSTKADGSGRVRTTLLLNGTSYPDGGVYVVAGEYGDGPLGLGPAPASASNWVFVC
jgi:hypothetical protein